MWKLPLILLLINWFLSCSHFCLKGRKELDWEGILSYPLLDPDLKYLRPGGENGRWGGWWRTGKEKNQETAVASFYGLKNEML